MKKKILYLFILGCIFILPNSIEARSAEACSKEDAKANLKMDVVTSGILGQRFTGLLGADHSTIYFRMTLDGTKALCVSQGLSASSNDKYVFSGIATNDNYIKAFAFYKNEGNYEGSDTGKWLIAQYVAWNGVDEDAIKQILYYDREFNGAFRHGNSQYSDLELDPIATKVVGTINSSTGTFYIWKNTTKPGGQDMITTLAGCKEITEEDVSCKLGEMAKVSPGMSCDSTKKGGNKIDGFTYLSTSGNRSDVHVEYGEEKALSGNAYCRVYCEEYGAATMPSKFGEKLQLGSYMIWPTSSSNSNSKFYKDAYPLRFWGKLTCKIGILPDENMPFACKKDPVAEYSKLYISLKSNHKKSTYKRKPIVGTLEDMRQKITEKVTESPDKNVYKGWCKNAYDNEDWAVSKEYKYSEAIIIRDKAAAEYQKAANAVNNYTGEKTYEVTYSDGAHYTQTTAEYQALLDAEKTAYDFYKAKQDIVDSIETGIDECADYTYNFEVARQILLTYKECAEYNATTDLYDFSSSASFSYSDVGYKNVVNIYPEKTSVGSDGEMSGNKGLIGDNFKTTGLKFDDLKKQETDTAGELSSIVDTIKSREFSITKENSYMLMTEYKYLDKDKFLYTKTEPKANYIYFDKTVIPSSFENVIGEDYWLTISNISFGMAGFGADEQGNGSVYACPVQFTKQRTPDTCICPEGTANAGKDLTCMNIDQDITCPDAQIQYCEDTSVEIPEECPPGDKTIYCPSPNDNISIGSCINSGMSYADCVAKYCPGAEDIKCPDTYGSSASNMDEQLRDCVQVKMAQGMSKAQAIAVCEPLVCPGGRRIIYRTIRLENPFPSYDSDTKVTQANLQVGMFNNTVKGRYPGSNWNGVLTVYNKIRNNRGTATKDKNTAKNTNKGLVGTTIYQTKTPLYTFVLNGEKISNIRDYNKNQQKGYNDFNLDCTKNNSVACVSSFVHNPLYGLTGGECQNVSKQKSSFYSCAKR